VGGQDRVRPTVFYPAKQALGARQFSFVVNFISLALPVPRGHGAFRDAKWRKGGKDSLCCEVPTPPWTSPGPSTLTVTHYVSHECSYLQFTLGFNVIYRCIHILY